MGYNKWLDGALKFLDEYNHGSYVYYDRNDNPDHINNKKKQVEGKKDQLYWYFERGKIDQKYWWPIIDQLIGDGYVKPHFESKEKEEQGLLPHQIKITYKGTAFINKFMGGYVWQWWRKFFTTGIAITATIIGIFWVAIQIWDKFFSCHCCCHLGI